MTNRHSQIIEVLSKHHQVEVNKLAKLMGVSQVTMRKDLTSLEEQGFVQRKHGYAVLNTADDISKRMTYHHATKRKIAAAAAAIVDEGETVIIESGSCCALLAEELAKAQKNITIITNSVFITNHIRRAKRTNIILLGGHYQSASQVVVGPMTRKYGEAFFTHKFFVGANGYIPGFGFTGKDHMRSQTVMDMAENAQGIFVLTEAEKFQYQGIHGLVRLEQLNGIFTDDRIPEEIEKHLLERNIMLHKVQHIHHENNAIFT